MGWPLGRVTWPVGSSGRLRAMESLALLLVFLTSVSSFSTPQPRVFLTFNGKEQVAIYHVFQTVSKNTDSKHWDLIGAERLLGETANAAEDVNKMCVVLCACLCAHMSVCVSKTPCRESKLEFREQVVLSLILTLARHYLVNVSSKETCFLSVHTSCLTETDLHSGLTLLTWFWGY